MQSLVSKETKVLRSKGVIFLIFLWLGFFCSGSSVFAVLPTESEVRILARDLAPKVNFFRVVWNVDPKAEFYAGTTRDYLYWILGKFRDAKNRGDVARISAELRSLNDIDIQEILGPDSDVDVMTNRARDLSRIEAREFGVRKLDTVNFDRLNPATNLGRTEFEQGFVPAEKLRMSFVSGLNAPDKFGNGVEEIRSGKLTMTFGEPEKFWKTHYAELGMNHPSLLALRFIRLLAQDYFNRHGSGYPDKDQLFSKTDPKLVSQVREVILASLSDPRFRDFLQNKKGRSWFNAAVLKSFRSHTNPTASFLAMKYFGVDQLIAAFPDEIQPINQFLFRELRDEKQIEENFRKVGVNPAEVLEPFELHFPNGRAYHGAGSYEAFRAMIFQGAIPSENGSAGGGFYLVGEDNLVFAGDRAKSKSGRSDLITEVSLSPKTRILDLTKDRGQRMFEAWSRFNLEIPRPERETEFARAFGIDLLIYPYEVKAFVVKNSAVIEAIQGYHFKLKPLGEILKDARALTAERLPAFLSNFVLRGALPSEMARILSEMPEGVLDRLAESGEFKKALQELPSVVDHIRVSEVFLKAAKLIDVQPKLTQILEGISLAVIGEGQQKMDRILDDKTSIEDLISFLTLEQRMQWFESSPNLYVRRQLIKKIGEASTMVDRNNASFWDQAFEDKDGLIQVMAARAALKIINSSAYEAEARRILLWHAKDFRSSGHEAALEGIESNYQKFEALSVMANVINNDPAPSAQQIALFWMNRGLSGMMGPNQKKFDYYRKRYFPRPISSYAPLLGSDVLEVRTLAAKGILHFAFASKSRARTSNSKALQKALDIVFEGLKNNDPSVYVRFHSMGAVEALMANAPEGKWKKQLMSRLLEGLKNGAYSNESVREMALKGLYSEFKENPQLRPVLLKIHKEDKSAEVRLLAVVTYLSLAPQTEESLPYLFEVVDAASSPSLQISAHALECLTNLGRNLSKVFAVGILQRFSNVSSETAQRSLADLLTQSTPRHFEVSEKLYPYMTNAPIQVQNAIARGFIEQRSRFTTEAAMKLLKYIEDRISEDRVPGPGVYTVVEYDAFGSAVIGWERLLQRGHRMLADPALQVRLAKLLPTAQLDDFGGHQFRNRDMLRNLIVKLLEDEAERTGRLEPEMLEPLRQYGENIGHLVALAKASKSSDRQACARSLRSLQKSAKQR